MVVLLILNQEHVTFPHVLVWFHFLLASFTSVVHQETDMKTVFLLRSIKLRRLSAEGVKRLFTAWCPAQTCHNIMIIVASQHVCLSFILTEVKTSICSSQSAHFTSGVSPSPDDPLKKSASFSLVRVYNYRRSHWPSRRGQN